MYERNSRNCYTAQVFWQLAKNVFSRVCSLFSTILVVIDVTLCLIAIQKFIHLRKLTIVADEQPVATVSTATVVQGRLEEGRRDRPDSAGDAAAGSQ